MKTDQLLSALLRTAPDERLRTWIERAFEVVEKQGAERFDEFWKLYPRKESKDAARKAWVRMEGDANFEAIMNNLRGRLRVSEWVTKDPGLRQFIPHAATYLNQRRWLDVPVPRVPPVRRYERPV